MPPRRPHCYGFNHLHYLTANVYRRARVFDSDRFKLKFVQALGDLREELGFRIIGRAGWRTPKPCDLESNEQRESQIFDLRQPGPAAVSGRVVSYFSRACSDREARQASSVLRQLAGRYAEVMGTDFEVLGDVKDIESIAINLSIRERKSLTSRFGGRRWRKLKGVALVRFPSGGVRRAELHWYEAHGVGRRKMKVKRVLD